MLGSGPALVIARTVIARGFEKIRVNLKNFVIGILWLAKCANRQAEERCYNDLGWKLKRSHVWLILGELQI
jgi:hypothetical protein